MAMTEQMRKDLASVQNLGFENVKGNLSQFSRGSAAGALEDVLELDDAAVRTSDTRKIRSGNFGESNPYEGSTETYTERARKQVGGK